MISPISGHPPSTVQVRWIPETFLLFLFLILIALCMIREFFFVARPLAAGRSQLSIPQTQRAMGVYSPWSWTGLSRPGKACRREENCRADAKTDRMQVKDGRGRKGAGGHDGPTHGEGARIQWSPMAPHGTRTGKRRGSPRRRWEKILAMLSELAAPNPSACATNARQPELPSGKRPPHGCMALDKSELGLQHPCSVAPTSAPRGSTPAS